jgi:hypothetical protein
MELRKSAYGLRDRFTTAVLPAAADDAAMALPHPHLLLPSPDFLSSPFFPAGGRNASAVAGCLLDARARLGGGGFFLRRRGLVPPAPPLLLLVVPYRSETESEEKLRLREEKSVDDLAVPASSSNPSASLLNGAASPSVSLADDDDQLHP